MPKFEVRYRLAPIVVKRNLYNIAGEMEAFEAFVGDNPLKLEAAVLADKIEMRHPLSDGTALQIYNLLIACEDLPRSLMPPVVELPIAPAGDDDSGAPAPNAVSTGGKSRKGKTTAETDPPPAPPADASGTSASGGSGETGTGEAGGADQVQQTAS